MRHVTKSLALVAAITTTSVIAPQLVAAEASKSAVGFGGYCAVCIVESNHWVPGKPEITCEYDGQVYYFPAAGVRDKFAESRPQKYVPVLGGDCIICYQAHGHRNPGKVEFSARHKGRIYLFPNQQLRDKFVASPEQYENADIAAGGKCIVCKVNAGHDTPGKTEFTALHDGLRYLFPSDKQRQEFLASPEKYVSETAPADTTASEQPESTEGQLVNFTGTTECAACNHGIHPIGEPDELGLAVKTATGAIYVIEGASKQYPEIYQNRYDGLDVAVSGKVIAEKDGFRWVEPTDLTKL